MTADQNPDAKAPPAFTATIDIGAKTIFIAPVAVRPVAKRSYALWLVEKQGFVPLGVIAPSGPTTVAWPRGADRAELTGGALIGATLAVSLEPEGGTAEAPSGPIIFEGRLAARQTR